MTKRYFVDRPLADLDSDASVELDGSEAQHLLQVMRAEVGDEVVLFDGSGCEFDARISERKRSSACLRVLARRYLDRELPRPVVLGVALPKGDRQRWLIEKAVELGVAALVPLDTTRGVAQPADNALARLRRTVIEAAKQSGRNRLMAIHTPQQVGDFLRAKPPQCAGLVAHPGGVACWPTILAAADQEVHLAIGPEGGFTDDELAACDGWQLVDLGPRILRIETAALALAACLSLGPPCSDE